MGFWNKKCENFTKLLWIPKKSLPENKNERKNFTCANKHISFSYYSGNIDINPKLQFKPIPIIDNSEKKEKLRHKLDNKEYGRLGTEILKKPEADLDDLFNKHNEMNNKIEIKINNLDKFIRSYRIQILPNENQKKIIQRWFNSTTKVYNFLVNKFMDLYYKYRKIEDENNSEIPIHFRLADRLKKNTEFPINFHKLRMLLIDNFTKKYKDTPYCVIADVIKEFITGIKSNLTQMKKNKITEFFMKARKFNRVNKEITIESHYTTADGFYSSSMKKIVTKDKNFKWDSIVNDYKLIYDRYSKKYYIHAPRYIEKKKLMKQKNY